MNEEIEKLKTEGVGERELQKAKNQLRASETMGRQTVFSKSMDLHHYRLYHGDVAAVHGDLDRYRAVTVEDIRRVARTYLVPANRSVVIAEPTSAAATEE